MSDKFTINHWWFDVHPETNADYYGFTFLLSFFGVVASTAGHELIHHREPFNKLVGMWPNTKFMYSHFIHEHLKGHHKTVATLDDPATGEKNETLYHFVLKSVLGSHKNVWKYENDRIIS